MLFAKFTICEAQLLSLQMSGGALLSKRLLLLKYLFPSHRWKSNFCWACDLVYQKPSLVSSLLSHHVRCLKLVATGVHPVELPSNWLTYKPQLLGQYLENENYSSTFSSTKFSLAVFTNYDKLTSFKILWIQWCLSLGPHHHCKDKYSK